MYWKRSNSSCSGSRRDKVALRTACIINVKFKIIRIRTGCQHMGYVYYSENLNWATQNLRLGRMRPEGRGLDIAGLDSAVLTLVGCCQTHLHRISALKWPTHVQSRFSVTNPSFSEVVIPAGFEVCSLVYGFRVEGSDGKAMPSLSRCSTYSRSHCLDFKHLGVGCMQGFSANKNGAGTQPKIAAILKQLKTHFKAKCEKSVGTPFPRNDFLKLSFQGTRHVMVSVGGLGHASVSLVCRICYS